MYEEHYIFCNLHILCTSISCLGGVHVLLMFYFLVDLSTGVTVGNVSHDSKINWLEVIILLCVILILIIHVKCS